MKGRKSHTLAPSDLPSARQAKPGLLESANGGTVLLDEVVDLPLPVQAKLLRAVDNREIYRVGVTGPTRLDVRFIAASNQSYLGSIEAGRFCAELYHRLSGISLRVPPLRERRFQILPMAEDFARAASERARQSPPRIAPRAAERLLEHGWPGNVRELKQAIERAVLLAAARAATPTRSVWYSAATQGSQDGVARVGRLERQAHR